MNTLAQDASAIPDVALDRSTIARLLVRALLIVGGVEALLMALITEFELFRHGGMLVLADPLMLVAASAPLLLVLVIRPFVAERRRALTAAHFLAYHDFLTRLPNRRLFDEHLRHRLAGQARADRFSALLYFDLDGFKPINDQHGHEIGDLVLAEIGRRLARSVRAGEVVARVGGDEFAVLVGDAGDLREPARRLAEELALRISTLVREPIDVGSARLQVGCTIGIHLLAPGVDSPRQALAGGDAAMYHAKRGLPGSIVFSDQLSNQRCGIVPIGVDAIDREHRELDRLIDAALKHEGSGGLTPVVAAIEAHFRSEVDISRQLRLNMTRQHVLEHHRLIDWLHRIRRQAGDGDVAESSLRAIADTLQEHVVAYDRGLCEVPFAPRTSR